MSNKTIQKTTQENKAIFEALDRIKTHILETPVVTFESINNEFGHEFYFKMESEQISKSFKIRGILNHIMELTEKNKHLSKIVTYTTGNHGIGLSMVCDIFHIKSRIYVPENVTSNKKDILLKSNSEIIITKTRKEAEDLSMQDSIRNDFYYLHPSSSDSTIAGAGTMCFEALNQMSAIGVIPDAIFGSCGGGGLLSGSLIARDLFCENLESKILLFGVEPSNANDAYLSRINGSIHRFNDSPNTIADGLRALSISQKTFEYIKMLDDIILVDDQETVFFTEKLNSLLSTKSEYSSCINMAAAVKFLSKQSKKMRVLILISGGNL